jgi:Na+/H+-dicarboxylate symporter
MPITKEMLTKAIKTAHQPCKEGCIHAEAFADAMDIVQKAIINAAMINPGDIMTIYFFAFHAGYRLHQMETEAVHSATAN